MSKTKNHNANSPFFLFNILKKKEGDALWPFIIPPSPMIHREVVVVLVAFCPPNDNDSSTYGYHRSAHTQGMGVPWCQSYSARAYPSSDVPREPSWLAVPSCDGSCWSVHRDPCSSLLVSCCLAPRAHCASHCLLFFRNRGGNSLQVKVDTPCWLQQSTNNELARPFQLRFLILNGLRWRCNS
ncbi:MAG: hypothetical protein US42_C0003G0029 [Candidatus Magasanikbacteria bacterium GW2011_GWC2_37_14]|uniref:Uncharacterized protein n=1 Tax=Candidatus Magasanikbacteria bacterium GW2011_GWC2_37_14 TaxID=1619046 RepID=A0A0G0GD92_9BACT|nr:MAG: hypothetical protein US42_C0003G0029 [Candidatus Magasanikbacteria bacterium GW2011_GWC2_37_14]